MKKSYNKYGQRTGMTPEEFAEMRAKTREAASSKETPQDSNSTDTKKNVNPEERRWPNQVVVNNISIPPDAKWVTLTVEHVTEEYNGRIIEKGRFFDRTTIHYQQMQVMVAVPPTGTLKKVQTPVTCAYCHKRLIVYALSRRRIVVEHIAGVTCFIALLAALCLLVDVACIMLPGIFLGVPLICWAFEFHGTQFSVDTDEKKRDRKHRILYPPDHII